MRTSKGQRGKISHLLDEIDQPLPDLPQACAYLQEWHCSIHYDADRVLDIWSPHQPINIRVRRAIRAHIDEVLIMMAADDAAVCPTALHKEYRRYDRNQGHFSCNLCRRIAI